MVDAILVLDFGGQFCHLIGRRIREHGVYSEIVPHDITPRQIEALNKRLDVKGLILSGGPLSVYERNAPKCDPGVLHLDKPVLGLCYGHQLIAYTCGGNVKAGSKKEFGFARALIEKPLGVLAGLDREEKVWMSHSDVVFSLPEEFEVLARTENCSIAAFRHEVKPIYGLQWHPEVVHTACGAKILSNFIFSVCGCVTNWRMEDFVRKAVQEISQSVGSGKAIVALSGGIDSSVTTALAAKALGKNLTAVFVDNGFMREQESEFVRRTFRGLDINLISVDARKEFLEALRGVTQPERKRKIVGREFVKVFEKVAENVGAEYLVQGTIYPDRIESGIRRFSERIKTHHNVAGLPAKIKFRAVVEPLKDLYKDEVRKVARKLGLSKDILSRQPFPGPGLAARVIGEVTEEKIKTVRRADGIVTEEIEKKGLQSGLWQYFAVLTDTRSTGVRGDSRAYGYTVAIRAVESKEAMTARYARISHSVLERISTRITNELPSVIRVVYDITHKPPATIEWE